MRIFEKKVCFYFLSNFLSNFFSNFFLNFLLNNYFNYIFLALKNGLKKDDVPALFPQLNKIIKGLLFTDQSDPAQNFMANEIIRGFYRYDLGEHTQNFHVYLDYVLNTWFRPNSPNFVGKYSNFHKEILNEPTPQLTNNPSESLNSSLKTFFKVGYISKATAAEGLRQFFLQKRLQMVTFANGHFANHAL